MKDKVYKLVEVGSSDDELQVMRQQVLHMEGRVEVAETTLARMKAQQYQLNAQVQDLQAQLVQLDAMIHNLLAMSRCTSPNTI
jgi:chromosome segregation ATPase